jgi:hypothetical protein
MTVDDFGGSRVSPKSGDVTRCVNVVDNLGVGAAAFVLPHEFSIGHVAVNGWGAT